MNMRVFAALFTAIFLVCAVPILLVQPSGLASAGLSAGFVLPFEHLYHIAILVAIGLVAACLGSESAIVLPVCTLLMLAIGSLMQVDEHALAHLHGWIGMAIILFALSVSCLRNKAHLFFIPPIAMWVYFAGNGYMNEMPAMNTPAYFFAGLVMCATLMLAIGVSLGVTLTDTVNDYAEKLKTLPAISSFLSLF